MIVNSGSLDNGDNSNGTDYGKLAKALGEIKNAGINISLADINNSDFSFKPDLENNTILFGLKGLLNINNELVQKIIENRPYKSPKDFINKVKPNKSAMISLIKAGAFDSMMERKKCMVWYLWSICGIKTDLNLRNFQGLMKANLISKELEFECSIFEFTRYLKTICLKNKTDLYYTLDERSISFLDKIEKIDLIEQKNNIFSLDKKVWDKYYQKVMDKPREWISINKTSLLDKINELSFMEQWNKYALGNISSWEMEVMCFYYHEHELINLNKGKYGVMNFFALPEEPIVERKYNIKNKEIDIYELHKICGTCIDKDKNKGTVTLLTTEGVVNVKFNKEYFALFDRQISQKLPDGNKKVIEKSFFNRGSMILVTGIRRGDNFVAKKYASTHSHQLYKIENIDKYGDIVLRHERAGGMAEDEEI